MKKAVLREMAHKEKHQNEPIEHITKATEIKKPRVKKAVTK